jgi:hypothetical protein
MSNLELVAQLPGAAAFPTPPAVPADADIDRRWAAWTARGRAHEQRVRRRLVAAAGVLAVGAAVVYAFFRP